MSDYVFCPHCRQKIETHDLDDFAFEDGPNPATCPECGKDIVVVQETTKSFYSRVMVPGEFDA